MLFHSPCADRLSLFALASGLGALRERVPALASVRFLSKIPTPRVPFLKPPPLTQFRLIVGGALVGVAFGSPGRHRAEPRRTTITEIAMGRVSGCIVAAALLVEHQADEPRRDHPAAVHDVRCTHRRVRPLVDRAEPQLPRGTGRMFCYLVLFCAAVAAGESLRGRRRLLLAILVGATVPGAFALASRIWPGALAENEVSNRLGQPFDYWNAVGGVAAMAVPAALGLGSRRSGGMFDGAHARVPRDGRVRVLAILLTQSRGAAAAAAAGAVIWFGAVPLRLRSLRAALPRRSPRRGGLGALEGSVLEAFSRCPAKQDVADEFGVLVV